MVFTGEMEAFSRQDAEDKAKAAGAKVMGSVSGNTAYLVVGSRLDDGRPVEQTGKYRKYEELKAKGKKCPQLLTEQEFLKLLPGAASPAPAPVVAQLPPRQPSTAMATGVQQWVDSHAPRSFGELVGNASAVKKLTEWLRDWDDVVLRGQTKRAAFKPGGGMPENINARAALLSGPPGIGKTTSARLVAQLQGWEVLEYNASDARGAKAVKELASGIAENRTLNFGGKVNNEAVPKLTKRACIIMDEVDGMGAGDRGGNAELIKLVKKTKNPVICICNDSQSQKTRSLAFSCYDIKFQRPSKTTVAQRVAAIAAEEGLPAETNALEALAESCGNDIRQVLNQLQMMAHTAQYQNAGGVRYMDVKGKISKDESIMLTPFDACRNLLTSSLVSKMNFMKRMDQFFVDYSLVGLLIQENYLKAVEKRNEPGIMQRCAYSADLIATSDILSRKINENQDWSLLPDVGVLGAVYPSHITNGFVSFPSFPQFLGKYSTQSRMARLSQELRAHTKLSSTVGKRHLQTSGYTDLLYAKAVRPLLRGNPEAIEASSAMLGAYGLQREHIAEHLTELRTHLGGEDCYKLVDPRLKASMTKELGKGPAKVVLSSKKRKASGAPEALEDDEDEPTGKVPEGADADAGSDDEDKGSNLIKVKKAKAKGKAVAKDEPSPKAKAKAKGKAKAKR